MHELCQVEPGEVATYQDVDPKNNFNFKVTMYGEPVFENSSFLEPGKIVKIINHPDRIIRRPKVTDEQLYALEAVYRLFGMKWLTMGPTGYAYFSVDKPEKHSNGWIVNRMLGEPMCTNTIRADLSSLVSWSDPEPLDIVQTLRANGVEIDND
jgi:hypothetical protein